MYLSKALENVVFLSREGLPFRGNWVPADKEGEAGAEVNSNFHQLLLLRAKKKKTKGVRGHASEKLVSTLITT